MKILIVSPRLPWPPRDGGQICIAQHLALLSQEHECRLVSLRTRSAPVVSQAVPPDLRLPAPDLIDVDLASPAVSWAKSALTPWPATLHRYRSARLAERVREVARAWRPDVALAEHLHLAFLCAAVPEVPWAVVEHNVESLFLERVARAEPPLRRFLFERDARKMRVLEPRLLRTADSVIALDEREAAWIRDRVPGVPVHVVPMGIPAEAGAKPETTSGFLLLGSWRWAPNREAAGWFLGQVWPSIRGQDPRIEVTVAGRDSSATELGFDAPGVRWEGEVDDVAPYFARARALVVPLRTGAGLRVKILEAMATGTAVIATPEGVGGLDPVHGTHLWIATGAEELADAVLALEHDPGLARRLGDAGRSWALARFGMPQARERLEAAMRDAAKRGHARLGARA